MAKILIICTSRLGHNTPSLPLTQELVRRGHDVVYAVPEGFQDIVAATGAKTKIYDSLWS